MGNFSTPLIKKTREYVAGFIADNFTEKICYHNIDHTLEVVEASEFIGKKLNISEANLEIVVLAAWFHDTGYFLGCANHEEASSNIAARYLERETVDSLTINKIINCIMATKIPQTPKSTLEKIICDADLYHLATDKFFGKSELLLNELTLHNQEIDQKHWLIKSKEFVETHTYHTSFGKEILFPELAKNLELLNQKIREYDSESDNL